MFCWMAEFCRAGGQIVMVGVRVYEAISRFGQHVVPGRDDESDDAVLKSYLYLTRHLTLFCVRVRPPLSFWRPCGKGASFCV